MESPDLLKMYNDLDIDDKRQELAEEFTELILIIKRLRMDAEIPVEQEETDLRSLYEQNVTEDVYLTYLYKNILDLKEELGEYLEKIVDAYYE